MNPIQTVEGLQKIRMKKTFQQQLESWKENARDEAKAIIAHPAKRRKIQEGIDLMDETGQMVQAHQDFRSQGN